MNNKMQTLLIIGLIITISCSNNIKYSMSEIERWKLGWRMIASSMNANYELASSQFDTLRNSTKVIDKNYLVIGLEAKSKIGKDDEVVKILILQDKRMLQEICDNNILSKYETCKEYSIEKVDNKPLQIELVKMYVNDQFVRSNLMKDMLQKFNLTKNEVIIDSFGVNTDEHNRKRLKQIIEQYGFPSKKLVGKDAMERVFMIIQHSDEDKEWQKSQLSNIEKSVKNGDMDGQNYAYLYDRIKTNNAENQLYGTQFSKVDLVKMKVELFPTEDLDNLDKRRMQIGLMPIDMYKEFMLKNSK